MKLKKGDTVWLWSHLKRKEEIKETTVKSSGTKYITTEYDDRIKFDACTLREVNGCGHSAFLITDLVKHKIDNHYKDLISALNNFKWAELSRAELDSVSDIIKQKEGRLNT